MRTKAKVNSKTKSIKKSATNTKILDQNVNPTGINVVNSGADKERDPTKNFGLNTKSLDQNSCYLEDAVVHNDLWMLKYDIDEMGIGKILLPPSLSILLQSDRVCISPSAGGLFIRSN
jgi:hypothetical protein